jgi:hypothetical protein
MVKLSSGTLSRRQALRRLRSIFLLTIRQRIAVYLVIAGVIALACAGVDYNIDANSWSGEATNLHGKPIANEDECHAAEIQHDCQSHLFAGGQCRLTICTDPPDKLDPPETNCTFGKTNGSAAWTETTCKARTLGAGCSVGDLYSFGCYGYSCTNLQCGQ